MVGNRSIWLWYSNKVRHTRENIIGFGGGGEGGAGARPDLAWPLALGFPGLIPGPWVPWPIGPWVFGPYGGLKHDTFCRIHGIVEKLYYAGVDPKHYAWGHRIPGNFKGWNTASRFIGTVRLVTSRAEI